MPRKPAQSGAMPLPQLLNHNQPLYRLATVLNWGSFAAKFGQFYAEGLGRPALATRLMVFEFYQVSSNKQPDFAMLGRWLSLPKHRSIWLLNQSTWPPALWPV